MFSTNLNSDKIRDAKAQAEGIVDSWHISESLEDFVKKLGGRFDGKELELWFCISKAYYDGQQEQRRIK